MHDRNLVAVLITVDRSPSPNYLHQTLLNLNRSDLLTSERLGGLVLLDSGPGFDWAVRTRDAAGLRDTVHVVGPTQAEGKRIPNINVAAALRVGAELMTEDDDWIIFLEDDIDVCDRFFDSVGAWLDDHAVPERRVYPLGANYPPVQLLHRKGQHFWDYPIKDFYGTQGFAIRVSDARSLSYYLQGDPFVKNEQGAAWDLIMHDWAREHYPAIEHFRTPSPSFVQHIGRESVIAPRPTTHTFPSWPGPDWSYRRKAVPA